jgi:flagellar motor component MotA
LGSIASLGTPIVYLLDLPSLFIVLVPLLGILLATKSFKTFVAGIVVAASLKRKKATLSAELREQIALLFRLLSKSTAIICAIAFLICLLALLFGFDFSDSDVLHNIGINIAIALITPLYGMILITGLFEPIVYILRKRDE